MTQTHLGNNLRALDLAGQLVAFLPAEPGISQSWSISIGRQEIELHLIAGADGPGYERALRAAAETMLQTFAASYCLAENQKLTYFTMQGDPYIHHRWGTTTHDGWTVSLLVLSSPVTT